MIGVVPDREVGGSLRRIDRHSVIIAFAKVNGGL